MISPLIRASSILRGIMNAFRQYTFRLDITDDEGNQVLHFDLTTSAAIGTEAIMRVADAFKDDTER